MCFLAKVALAEAGVNPKDDLLSKVSKRAARRQALLALPAVGDKKGDGKIPWQDTLPLPGPGDNLRGDAIVQLMIEKRLGIQRRPVEVYEDQIESLFEEEEEG